jgi:alginate O-acetyltransferase complex protein AlgI
VDVPSYLFLGFGAIVALLINLSNNPLWRRCVLVVANLAFVLTFTHDPVQLVPFAGLLALGYLAMKLVAKHKRLLPAALIALLVLVFCWLKHYTFIPSATWLTFAYFTVGMSYVFFRVLHLVIESAQDALTAPVGPLAYLSYTLNFTCLVSGPIQFYEDYLRTESAAPLPLDSASVSIGLSRIILGFFKVGVVSQLLWELQQRVVELPPALSVGERALHAAAILALFPVYLFFNFSGYTDFVIGLARFLRLELPENFNHPFIAETFIEFWSRWHMTLSNWLKTYVYSPLLLALMKRYESPAVQPYLGVIAYFVTFFLVGVWHGQTSMFLFFGVLQGLGVSVNKLFQIQLQKRLGRPKYRELTARPFCKAISRGATFTWFAFTLLWFWSSWPQLGGFIAQLGIPAVLLGVLVVYLAATILLEILARWYALETSAESPLAGAVAAPVLRAAWYSALAVVLLSVTILLNAPAPHIVYKAF